MKKLTKKLIIERIEQIENEPNDLGIQTGEAKSWKGLAAAFVVERAEKDYNWTAGNWDETEPKVSDPAPEQSQRNTSKTKAKRSRKNVKPKDDSMLKASRGICEDLPNQSKDRVDSPLEEALRASGQTEIMPSGILGAIKRDVKEAKAKDKAAAQKASKKITDGSADLANDDESMLKTDPPGHNLPTAPEEPVSEPLSPSNGKTATLEPWDFTSKTPFPAHERLAATCLDENWRTIDEIVLSIGYTTESAHRRLKRSIEGIKRSSPGGLILEDRKRVQTVDGERVKMEYRFRKAKNPELAEMRAVQLIPAEIAPLIEKLKTEFEDLHSSPEFTALEAICETYS